MLQTVEEIPVMSPAPELYRSLFENLPLPAWVYDTQTLRFLEVNQAASRRYGFSRPEFLVMTIMDIWPPEDVPRLLESLDLAPDSGATQTESWLHRAKDNSVFEVESTARPVAFEGREAMLVVARDLPARQELRWME
ncbi:MAG TPA: PAS domain S-box protein [Verrucomicrobiae bacterium]|nr:PAS domain S-box protein [Verrucomicrobiae bacterium]